MNIGHADRLTHKNTHKKAPRLPWGAGHLVRLSGFQAFKPSGPAALWMLGQGRLEVEVEDVGNGLAGGVDHGQRDKEPWLLRLTLFFAPCFPFSAHARKPPPSGRT